MIVPFLSVPLSCCRLSQFHHTGLCVLQNIKKEMSDWRGVLKRVAGQHQSGLRVYVIFRLTIKVSSSKEVKERMAKMLNIQPFPETVSLCKGEPR